MLDHRPCDCRDTIDKLGPINDVCIVEEAVLVAYHQELGLGEMLLDHPPYVLAVVEVQGRVHLVEDVEGRRLEPAEEREREKGGEGRSH